MAKGILNVGGGVVSVDASGNFTVETGLIADGASVFNETGVDVDFRIESDDNANMLFVDGGNDRVGIGVATPAAQLEVEQGSTGGVVAFTIDNNDTDKVAMSIEAANIDADVMDISMDAVTTARGIDITADGLTTGSALRIDSDSSSTGTRTIASIIQNNTSASGATTLFLQNDHATAPALRVVGAVQIGVDDVGHDVKFFGATASRYWLWDESADGVVQRGTLTVGVDDTGHDVIFYGAASGAFMQWDEDENSLVVRGAAADAAGSSGRLSLETAQVSVEDGDILGRVDFRARLETQGSDASLVSASIWAEADATFTATVNNTELIFATGESEAAAEKMRLTSDGDLILGPAVGAAIWFGDGDSGLTEGSDDDLVFKGAGSTLIAFRSAERRFRADATGSPNIYINAGTVGAPTYSFNDDSDSGMCRTAANELAIVTGGTSRVKIDANGKFGFGSTAAQQSQYFFHHPNQTSISAHGTWDNCVAGFFNGTQDNTITQLGFGYQSGSTTHPAVTCGYYNNNSGAAGMGNFFVCTRNGTAHTTAPSERLRVSNAGDTYTNNGNTYSLSDIRAKKDITDLADGLDIVNQLRPRTFKYNGKTTMGTDDGVTNYGFIADEVLSVASQYVDLHKEVLDGENVNDFKTLSTGKFIPMLVNAIKELSVKNDALETKVTALENA